MVVFAEKAYKQTTIVFYKRIRQARETVGVQAVAVGIIVLVWCKPMWDKMLPHITPH